MRHGDHACKFRQILSVIQSSAISWSDSIKALASTQEERVVDHDDKAGSFTSVASRNIALGQTNSVDSL